MFFIFRSWEIFKAVRWRLSKTFLRSTTTFWPGKESFFPTNLHTTKVSWCIVKMKFDFVAGGSPKLKSYTAPGKERFFILSLVIISRFASILCKDNVVWSQNKQNSNTRLKSREELFRWLDYTEFYPPTMFLFTIIIWLSADSLQHK